VTQDTTVTPDSTGPPARTVAPDKTVALAAASRELVISRVFDAPLELVYRAFTDPDQLAQWFGPVGYSVPRDSIEIDARAGGRERFVMVSDEDPSRRITIDYTFSGVIENQLLVDFSEEGVPGTDGIVRMTSRLEFHDEEGGRTRLEMWAGPFTDQDAGDARLGWESSFTKLDAVLKAA
jgi:uncharacterized protein YndB with AHSA1/START domain